MGDAFDPNWYLAKNPDVADARIDPLRHWLQYGHRERRPVSPSLIVQYDQSRSWPPPWRRCDWNGERLWILRVKPESWNEPSLFKEPGHYYSPIVVPDQILAYGLYDIPKSSHLFGIYIDYSKMLALFLELSQTFKDYEFEENPTARHRFYSPNEFFSGGDALILSAFIKKFHPRQIVEVGSGFSSAVILDTLDVTDPEAAVTRVTCVDPNPEGVHRLLRAEDQGRITVKRSFVQHVEPDVFTQLARDDILFLDTTHICKTGSDINFELFTVLPLLQSGVIIHFHDVFHGFEYPTRWVVDDNRSWNEIYLLRAFLMHNAAYEILMVNESIALEFGHNGDLVPKYFREDPGAGLWLRKL